MSVIAELNIEYNRFLSLALIALARENYYVAKSYLDKSAKALNELTERMSGETKEYMRDWLFDMVKVVGELEKKAGVEKAKSKLNKMLEERGCLAPENGSPSARRNKFEGAKIPQTTFDDIAGLDDVKEAVRYKVIYPRKYPELYDTFKKRSGGGILLYGLPGTGKTLIAEAIAHETEATFFPVKCSDLGSKWFGETEQNIRDVFDAAREAKNAVIFFDEIEAYASSRRDNSAMERCVPEFLTQMQGIGASEEKNRILVIGATNKPWRLDSAFLRPGRFDEKIYVPLPCEDARMQILSSRLKDIPVENFDLHAFIAHTDGFNGADMDYLCEKAKECAIKRILARKENEEALLLEDFEKAFEGIKSSVLESDRKEMEAWIQKYSLCG